MPSFNQPFVIVAGDDASLAFTIYAANGTTPLDLTGAAITWQMRSSWDSATALLTKTMDSPSDITVTDADSGTFTIAIADTDTDSIIPGRYPHAVKITDASSNETTVTLGYGQILAKAVA